jgi:hypothetical protein
MAKRVLVTAACTGRSISEALQLLLPDMEYTQVHVMRLTDTDTEALQQQIENSDYWIYLNIREAAPIAARTGNGIAIPEIAFNAFHPDETSAHDGKSVLMGPMESLHSAIGIWAYNQGCTSREAARLFRPDVFEALGYMDCWDSSAAALAQRCLGTGIDYERLMRHIKRHTPFMTTVLHPRISVIAEIARQLAEKMGYVGNTAHDPIEHMINEPMRELIWPIYPGVAERYGMRGSLRWRHAYTTYHTPESFLEACYAAYPERGAVLSARVNSAYDRILGALI